MRRWARRTAAVALPRGRRGTVAAAGIGTAAAGVGIVAAVGIETEAAVAAGMAGTDGTIGELPRRGSKLDEELDALVEGLLRQKLGDLLDVPVQGRVRQE